METVLRALKAMGKANSVELAARLDISREEVLNELWELKKNDVVDKTGNTWFLAGEAVSEITAEKPTHPESQDAVTTATAQKVTTDMMTEFIGRKGPKTNEELAAQFGVSTRKVASMLAMVTGKGRLNRILRDGKFRYEIPEAENGDMSALSLQDKQSHHEAENSAEGDELNRFPLVSESVAKASTEEFIQDVPSFTEKSVSSVMLPPLHAASRELRRAKKQVRKWERVCAALRELNKHRDIVRQLAVSDTHVTVAK